MSDSSPGSAERQPAGGAARPPAAAAAAETAAGRAAHPCHLFSATNVVGGSVLGSLSVSDVAAAASLRKEMTNAQAAREELKQLIDDAQYVITNHHGQHALENVTLFRHTETLQAKIGAKRERVRRLEKDVELAEQEFARLKDVNSALLAGVREKDRERSRVVVRLEAHEYCEDATNSLGRGVERRTGELLEARNNLAEATTALVSKLGLHHSEVMVREQEMLDLKLEADVLRTKLHLPSISTSQLAKEWHLRSCDNAQCVRARQNLRAARARLKQIEATMRLTGSFLSAGGGLHGASDENFRGGTSMTPSGGGTATASSTPTPTSRLVALLRHHHQQAHPSPQGDVNGNAGGGDGVTPLAVKQL